MDKKDKQAATGSAQAPAGRPRSARKWLTGVVWVVALAALAVSLYSLWRVHSMTEQAGDVAALNQQLDQKLSAQAKRIDALAKQYQKKVSQLATQQQLNNSVSRVSRQSQNAIASVETKLNHFDADTRDALRTLQKAVATRRAGARVADVQYLIRVARHQAQIQHDPAAMRTALNAAWQALSTMTSPQAHTLRDKIANVLAQLDDVTDDARTQIAQALATVADQIDALQPRTLLALVQQEDTGGHAAAGAHHKSSNWWQRIRTGVGDALSDIISVRYVDDVPPLLAPKQIWYLRHNLRLQLAAARMAALQGRASVYQQSLKRVEHAITQYYDVQSAPVKTVLAVLAKLNKRHLSPALPSLDGLDNALDALRQSMGGTS